MEFIIFESNSSSKSNLPPTIQFTPDGSFELIGTATVFNDQFSTNIIGDENTTTFVIDYTEFDKIIPYSFIDNNIWINASIPSLQQLTVYFSTDNSLSPDPKSVFDYYQDFSSDYSEIVLSNTQIIQSDISQFGGYVLQTVSSSVSYKISTFPAYGKVVIRKYVYFDGAFQGHLFAFQDENNNWRGPHIACGETGGPYPTYAGRLCYYVSTWTATDYIFESNKWYCLECVIDLDNDVSSLYINDELVISNIPNINGNTLRGTTVKEQILSADSGSPNGYVDLILNRKYIDDTILSINTEQINDTTWAATITNNSTDDIINTQIQISGIPTGNYKVFTKEITPIIKTIALPHSTNSSISFSTQFGHDVKLDSNCMFHVHVFIPPDASEGTVKLQLDWKTLPVEMIVNSDNTIINNSVASSINKSIVKTFNITSDMIGKHVILNFGALDTVQSISQIIFHKLSRLGSDAEDTFTSDLPILYADWHAELNTLGSQEEFKK
jgi:hypothetical protein